MLKREERERETAKAKKEKKKEKTVKAWRMELEWFERVWQI